MAGGSIQGGVVDGETDGFSYNIVADPVHVRDFQATILHQSTRHNALGGERPHLRDGDYKSR